LLSPSLPIACNRRWGRASPAPTSALENLPWLLTSSTVLLATLDSEFPIPNSRSPIPTAHRLCRLHAIGGGAGQAQPLRRPWKICLDFWPVPPSHSLLSIPDSRFPIPKSQFAIPISQFPIRESHFLISNSRFQFPNSRFPTPYSPLSRLVAIAAQTANHAALAGMCKLKSAKL